MGQHAVPSVDYLQVYIAPRGVLRDSAGQDREHEYLVCGSCSILHWINLILENIKNSGWEKMFAISRLRAES